MMLETRGDYQFAESVNSLSRQVSKLNKAFEEQLEINERLTVAIKQLTEVISDQYDQNQRLIQSLRELQVTDNHSQNNFND